MKKILLLILCVMANFKFIFANQYPYRFEGQFEEFLEHPLDLIQNYLPENPIIFEAGGHYGEDTFKISQKWTAGKIISFEPNPNAFEKLLELSMTTSNIMVYPFAVANFNGKGIFYVCYGSTGDNPIFEGASSLLPASDWMKTNYQGPQVVVDCVVLDDWCKSENITAIDFMWLDLEGMELQTLQSSPEILKTVSVIYTETNFLPFRVGMTQYSALKEFLEDSGFQLLAHWYFEGLQGNAIFIKSKSKL